MWWRIRLPYLATRLGSRYSIGSPNWRLGGGSGTAGRFVAATASTDLGSGVSAAAARRPPCFAGSWRGRPSACARARRPCWRLGGGRRLDRTDQALQRRPRGLLLGLLLGGAVPGAERLGAGERPPTCTRGCVPDLGTLAVVDRRLAEALLGDLLQAALEVLVLRRLRQRAVAVQVVVVGGVVAGVEEDRARAPPRTRWRAATSGCGRRLARCPCRGRGSCPGRAAPRARPACWC